MKDRVTAVGGELLGYIPNNAFKVRMNPGQANLVSKLDGVAWVGFFEPAYKLSPDLAPEGLVTVRIEQGANAAVAAALVCGGRLDDCAVLHFYSSCAVLLDFNAFDGSRNQDQTIASVLREVSSLTICILAEKCKRKAAGLSPKRLLLMQKLSAGPRRARDIRIHETK